jgi:hypothetical protein
MTGRTNSTGKSKSIICRDHCSKCGRHFTSTDAFDAHRIGSFRDPNDPRRCESPEDLANRLEKRAENGACTIRDDARPPVIVWGIAGAREKAKRAFSASPAPNPRKGSRRPSTATHQRLRAGSVADGDRP